MTKKEQQELQGLRYKVASLELQIHDLLNHPAGEGKTICSSILKEYNLPDDAQIVFKMKDESIITIQRDKWADLLTVREQGRICCRLKVVPQSSNVLMIGADMERG